MTSAPTDCRVPDPTDAKADGNFGNHRAGYGNARLQRITHAARQGWTLAAGEGAALVQEIDRLRDEIVRLREIVERTEWEREQAWQVTQQQERILAALREPSDVVIVAMQSADSHGDVTDAQCIEMTRAAVAAAEREVDHFGDASKMVRQEVRQL